jgi:glucose/arabinose dehydrogenase
MASPIEAGGRRIRSLAAALVVAAAALVTAAVAPAVARNAADPAASPSGTGFHLMEVLSDYDRPVLVTNDGTEDRLFVVQQSGKIKVATRDSTASPWEKAGVFLKLTSLVHDPDGSGNNERGLLGLAFHPDYLENDLFYVFYTRERDDKNVLVEYQRQSALKADPSSARVVFGIRHSAAGNHNGGAIHFGPDGYLYVATGDSGASSAPAQDIESRHGKLLRLDPKNPPGAAKYTIPDDNPFFGETPGHDLVWSYGLRNPWRTSHDPETGDLWIGDVGASTWEEIDHEAGPDAGRGDNYGWDRCEGDHPRTGTAAECGPGPSTTVRPVAEYGHGASRCSVTGGHVYRGADQPSLEGYYFFGEYCAGDIWRIPTDFDLADGDTLPSPLATSLNVSSFGVDGRGELYVVDHGGSIQLVVED